MKFSVLAAVAALASALLSLSCGGGGGSSSGNSLQGTCTIPQGNATITVTLSGDAQKQTITGVTGGYRFEGLSGGTYIITPSLEGYVFQPSSRTVTISGADVTGQDFTGSQFPSLVWDEGAWDGVNWQ